MDDRKHMQGKEPGFDTTDQPAEGGPYIEDRTSEKRAREQRKGSQGPDVIPVTGDTSPTATVEQAESEHIALFDKETTDQFRSRWQQIQSKFMGHPQASIQQADELVEDVIQSITRNFADRRGALEQRWNAGEQYSDEDLHTVLQQYRSFFDRLLTFES
jgi:hypothetical protein